MRGIRRRKDGRTCFIVARREAKEVNGGGAPVILDDTLPRVREGGGGRGSAMRVPLARGGSGAPVAASTAASSRSEHATGVTRGRVGVAAAQHVPLAAAWAGGVARALFDRRAPEIDRGPPVSRAR
jgi:hypothetical protein